MTELTAKTEAAPPRSLSDAVAAISRRVKRVTSIVQLHGEFFVPNRAEVKSPMQIRNGETLPEAQLIDTFLYVLVGFVFKATPSKEESSEHEIQVRNDFEDNSDGPEAAVTVSATFQIAYELEKSDAVPTQQELIAFAQINGRFNAMSYWREFLHSSLSRVGLPPYFIKPFDAAARLRKLNETTPALPQQSPPQGQ